jgi:hypothetical protein
MMIAPSTDRGIDTAGQERCDHAFIGNAGDGAAYEHALVADETDVELVREGVANFGHLLLDAGDDIEG